MDDPWQDCTSAPHMLVVKEKREPHSVADRNLFWARDAESAASLVPQGPTW